MVDTSSSECLVDAHTTVHTLVVSWQHPWIWYLLFKLVIMHSLARRLVHFGNRPSDGIWEEDQACRLLAVGATKQDGWHDGFVNAVQEQGKTLR